jgi:6-pyruvoyltetrahydropterin/6-carboxytetrahydropterin synthase
MATIISSVFSISSAHRLLHHEGLCHNLHGHNWEVRVDIYGDPDRDTGMVIDFHLLKEVVKNYLRPFDHTTILNTADEDTIRMLQVAGFPFIIVHGEPTCENLAKQFFWELRDLIKAANPLVDIKRITIEETKGNFAVYERP